MKPAALCRLAFVLAIACLASPVAWAQAQAENHAIGSIVSLVVTVDGAPAPAVEWFKDGKKVGDGLTLDLGAITAASAGVYTAKATNVVGSATSDPFTLTVNAAPSKPIIRVIAQKNSNVTVVVPPGTKVQVQK